MNEEALRELVREALARRLSTPASAAPAPRPVHFAAHMSHKRYDLPDAGGACLIEPAVACNHCGYCQSHGH
jgi:propanediol dehydratase small subunit